MAVTLGNYTNASGKSMFGNSDDTKPTRTVPVEDVDGNLIYAAYNDLFYELDKGVLKFYDNDDEWKLKGYNAD